MYLYVCSAVMHVEVELGILLDALKQASVYVFSYIFFVKGWGTVKRLKKGASLAGCE